MARVRDMEPTDWLDVAPRYRGPVRAMQIIDECAGFPHCAKPHTRNRKMARRSMILVGGRWWCDPCALAKWGLV